MPAFLVLIGLCWTSWAHAATTLTGDLPRRDGRPLEEIPGIDSHYGVLRGDAGAQLRTILTRPAGEARILPAILFVQWLSCDTIELSAANDDGWSRMLRGLIRESGMAVLRTEKPGVGDSPGVCASLDYETELGHHRAALAELRRTPGIDPRRIVIFGASMGATMAPLVAAEGDVAGVMIWGGGARTWLERTLGLERRAQELAGVPAAELDAYLRALPELLVRYLAERLLPTEIARTEPRLEAVWQRMAGTDGDLLYGRSASFHQQAQAQSWAAAWAGVTAPVLVLYGEYDWFEELAAHQLVVDVVNRTSPARARLAVIPQTDHHFVRYATPRAAFREEGGTVNAAAALTPMLRWLKQLR